MMRIERYCFDELRRMTDATRQIGKLLPEMRRLARQNVLQAALDEQMMVNRRIDYALRQIFDELGIDNTPIANVEVAAMVNATRRAFREHEQLRDVIMAQQAARLESYQATSFAGLASWFHQLRRHDVADQLDEVSERLRRAVRHIREIRASVSSLVQDRPHDYEPPEVDRPQDRTPPSDLVRGYQKL